MAKRNGNDLLLMKGGQDQIIKALVAIARKKLDKPIVDCPNAKDLWSVANLDIVRDCKRRLKAIGYDHVDVTLMKMPQALLAVSEAHDDGMPEHMLGIITVADAEMSDKRMHISDMSEPHAVWVDAYIKATDANETPPGHPFAPFVMAWVAATPDSAVTRRDRRVMPKIMVFDRIPGGEAPLPVGVSKDSGMGPRELPLFPDERNRLQVPLLNLVDSSGRPVKPVKAVPLAMRLMVMSMMSVEVSKWKTGSASIRMEMDELRWAIFPHGWRVGRDWPRLRDALVNAGDYGFRTGKEWGWYPVSAKVRHYSDTYDPNAPVVLDVAFPPGTESGPAVDLPALHDLMVSSVSRFRAYIAGRTVAFLPGITRRPHPRNRNLWVWTKDQECYPIITQAERKMLAFGEHDKMHRTLDDVDAAWDDLPGMVVVDKAAIDRRTGAIGWRILPIEALA